VSRSIYMKPKGQIGRCMACGRSTKLNVHQGCGAIMAAKRQVGFTPETDEQARLRRRAAVKTQL
jgi:hypothetical protein